MSTWSTQEVVRLTGVTSRTLRHYDDLGLLRPVDVGPGGIRRYGRPELLRLQQILLLRELGLGLPAIGTVLTGTTDRVAALRDHRDRLLAERERLTRLTATVEATINDLEGGPTVAEEQLFEGFEPERQAAYERELVEEWGVSGQAIAESQQAVRTLGRAGVAANEAQRADIERALLDLMAGGAAPEDERVLDALRGHWELTGRYWGRPPSAEAYAGLGQMYVDHPEFRDRYEAMAPGFAQWVSDAVTAYALTRLS